MVVQHDVGEPILKSCIVSERLGQHRAKVKIGLVNHHNRDGVVLYRRLKMSYRLRCFSSYMFESAAQRSFVHPTNRNRPGSHRSNEILHPKTPSYRIRIRISMSSDNKGTLSLIVKLSDANDLIEEVPIHIAGEWRAYLFNRGVKRAI
jgi:hypothetical protein